MPALLPGPEAIARFRKDLGALSAGDAPLALAVSGGPDSLALLLLAAAARPGTVYAATVDHGRRAESGAEARFVASLCENLDVPHETLLVNVPTGGDGLQAEARAARYAALARWMDRLGLSTLLTGHHADDQAETLLMRLQRGSGVGGLSGVRSRAGLPGTEERLSVLRPLLGWRRRELAGIVEASGLDAVDDPSNADMDFDRVRMRAHMSEASWLDVSALARSAAALAEAEEALDVTASRLFDERVQREGAVTLEAGGLPRELQRRLILRCLREIAPGAAPRGEQITALLRALANGEVTTLSGVKCTGGPSWRFEPAPPRRG